MNLGLKFWHSEDFRFQTGNPIAKTEMVGGHRQHSWCYNWCQFPRYINKANINISRQILTYDSEYQSTSKAVGTLTSNTKDHQTLLYTSLSLLPCSTFLLRSFAEALSFNLDFKMHWASQIRCLTMLTTAGFRNPSRICMQLMFSSSEQKPRGLQNTPYVCQFANESRCFCSLLSFNN